MSLVRSVVAGVGGHLPDRVMTNDELSEIVDTSDDWITQRTGIKQRRLAAKGETTSDLATAAAKAANRSPGSGSFSRHVICMGRSDSCRT